MSNKKLIATLTIGGLLLSGPFAALAATSTDSVDIIKERFEGDKALMTGSLLNQPDYDKQIERLEKAIEKKIEQANLLIAELDTGSVNIIELESIVEEYVKLETFLEEVEAEKEEADYLKEIFFEYKEDATDLTTEFRTILVNNLSDDELEILRESLRETQKGHRPKFNAETLEMIDSDLATQYANGELTEKEVMDAVKEIMDSLSEEEREALHSEMKEAGFEPRGPRGEGMGRRMHRNM